MVPSWSSQDDRGALLRGGAQCLRSRPAGIKGAPRKYADGLPGSCRFRGWRVRTAPKTAEAVPVGCRGPAGHVPEVPRGSRHPSDRAVMVTASIPHGPLGGRSTSRDRLTRWRGRQAAPPGGKASRFSDTSVKNAGAPAEFARARRPGVEGCLSGTLPADAAIGRPEQPPCRATSEGTARAQQNRIGAADREEGRRGAAPCAVRSAAWEPPSVHRPGIA
jgi:hypothetical protein